MSNIYRTRREQAIQDRDMLIKQIDKDNKRKWVKERMKTTESTRESAIQEWLQNNKIKNIIKTEHKIQDADSLWEQLENNLKNKNDTLPSAPKVGKHRYRQTEGDKKRRKSRAQLISLYKPSNK